MASQKLAVTCFKGVQMPGGQDDIRWMDRIHPGVQLHQTSKTTKVIQRISFSIIESSFFINLHHRLKYQPPISRTDCMGTVPMHIKVTCKFFSTSFLLVSVQDIMHSTGLFFSLQDMHLLPRFNQ
ncbi:hypothetical protein BSKO_09750 [Bryopsis sp. KO-2023]|nr:hypothetical protein BSKO_09750 [Bryopsis sp. KO-2023]